MRTPTLATVLVTAAAASQLGATDCGSILQDPGFDLWCGDKLCSWELERGDIQRAGTWHAHDDAVELLGDDTAISQLTQVNSWDTACIRFEMLADVAESTEVRLEADIFGDGSVEWSERIPTSSWDAVSLAIRVEGDYDGIRFRLTKAGAGRAVLARIAAEVADVCPEDGVTAAPRELGATCDEDADCQSGICWSDAICSACDTDADCGDGLICGHSGPVDAPRWAHQACLAPASRQLAEPCLDDDECATGVCQGGACGECDDAVACPDGATCAAPYDLPVAMCDPGAGDRGAGAACFVDADCASDRCDGADVGVCLGQWIPSICTADAHCFDGACSFIGSAGGTCQ